MGTHSPPVSTLSPALQQPPLHWPVVYSDGRPRRFRWHILVVQMVWSKNDLDLLLKKLGKTNTQQTCTHKTSFTTATNSLSAEQDASSNNSFSFLLLSSCLRFVWIDSAASAKCWMPFRLISMDAVFNHPSRKVIHLSRQYKQQRNSFYLLFL